MDDFARRIIGQIERQDQQLAQRHAERQHRVVVHYVLMTLGAGFGSALPTMVLVCALSLGLGSVLAMVGGGMAAGALIVILNRGSIGAAFVISAVCFPILMALLVFGDVEIHGFGQPIILVSMIPFWPILGIVLGLVHDAWDTGNQNV
jgi:hypothetical protein